MCTKEEKKVNLGKEKNAADAQREIETKVFTEREKGRKRQRMNQHLSS